MLRPSKLIAREREVNIVERKGLGRGLTSTLRVKPESKVCIIRSVGGIGDVLMMTPALREIKRRFPKCELTVAVDRHRTYDDCYYQILKNAPFIDHIIDARYVKRKQYNKVVDISAVCIPYERRDLPPRNRINIFSNFLGMQSLQDYLPFYKVEAGEFERSLNLLRKINDSRGPVIALHTASHEKKRTWPLENNIAFIKSIKQRVPDCRIVVFDFNNTFFYVIFSIKL